MKPGVLLIMQGTEGIYYSLVEGDFTEGQARNLAKGYGAIGFYFIQGMGELYIV